jgi:hypothetical protein
VQLTTLQTFVDVFRVLRRVLESSEQRGNASLGERNKNEQKILKLKLCVRREFHDQK